MNGRFIYVFSIEDRDLLASYGYQILKCDDNQNIYVFINDNSLKFSGDVSYVCMDTLTF